MTRCSDVDALVSSYIDGDIDEHRARAVRGHARECERCARLLEDEGVLASWLGDLDVATDPPERLWGDIQRRLATEELGDARRSKLALWWSNASEHAASAALVAAGLALGWFWIADRPRDSSVAPPAAPALAAKADAREPSAVPPTPEPPGDEITFAAHRRRQIADADEHYRRAVAELRAEVETTAAGELAGQLARLDGELAQARERAAGSDDPASRDEIHRLYREQIAVLQDAAIDGGWM